jgi:hypothetical protein
VLVSLLEGTCDRRYGIVGGGVGAGDADEIFVDAGRHQALAVVGLGKVHAMGLDAHMREARRPRPPREIRQIAQQRDLRAGEDKALPAPVLGIVRQQLLEARTAFRHEAVHRAFDHAVHAAQIAAKLHRHGDVVAMVEQLQNGLQAGSTTGRRTRSW